jgi:hypothetical protein
MPYIKPMELHEFCVDGPRLSKFFAPSLGNTPYTHRNSRPRMVLSFAEPDRQIPANPC